MSGKQTEKKSKPKGDIEKIRAFSNKWDDKLAPLEAKRKEMEKISSEAKKKQQHLIEETEKEIEAMEKELELKRHALGKAEDDLDVGLYEPKKVQKFWGKFNTINAKKIIQSNDLIESLQDPEAALDYAKKHPKQGETAEILFSYRSQNGKTSDKHAVVRGKEGDYDIYTPTNKILAAIHAKDPKKQKS